MTERFPGAPKPAPTPGLAPSMMRGLITPPPAAGGRKFAPVAGRLTPTGGPVGRMMGAGLGLAAAFGRFSAGGVKTGRFAVAGDAGRLGIIAEGRPLRPLGLPPPWMTVVRPELVGLERFNAGGRGVGRFGGAEALPTLGPVMIVVRPELVGLERLGAGGSGVGRDGGTWFA